jgi:hypothetical protein
MSVFGTYVLIVGLAVLLIVGLLRLVRDLLSTSAFAAPSSPDEERVVENAEDARLSGPLMK